MSPRTVSRYGLAVLAAALGIAFLAPTAGAATAPGAPGQRTTRASADKDGFGTAIGRANGGMIPEQVWDSRAPTGRGARFAPGEPT